MLSWSGKTLCAVFVLASLCAGSAFAKVTLTAVTMYNAENYQHRGLLEMGKRVAELTKGEVDIKVVIGSTLGFKGPDLLRAVGDGQVDIAEMVTSNVAGDAPVMGLRTLPMLVEDWDQIALFDKLAAPYYDAVGEKFSQKILVISPWPFGGLWATRKVESVGDMKGLKIRAYDRNGTLFAAAAGASGINVPYAEAYTGLATGLIDSVITSSISVREGKFYEVCRYHMPIRFASASSITSISNKAWNKLSPDQQKALSQAAAECTDFLWKEVKRVVEENDQYTYKNGVTLVPVSDSFHAGLVQLGEKVAESWLEQNKKSSEALELYKAFVQAKKRP